MTAGIAYPADYSATYSGPQYTANQGRTALSAAMAGATSARPLGGISGVRPGTPSTTVTATSTTWTAAAFAGYIDTAASATNGGYYFSFPSGGTGSVTAAVASPRIDIIYVQLSDVNTGDGTTVAPKVDVNYLAGTAGSGVAPSAPARSFVIANLNIPATGGGSPTVVWVSPYCVAAGGILPSPTRALLPATGSYVDQRASVTSDTTANNNGGYRWNGAAWTPDPFVTIQPTSVTLIANGAGGTGGTVALTGSSVTLTAASGVRLSGIFTNAYSRVRILWSGTSSAVADAKANLSSGGTPLTTNVYYWRVLQLEASRTDDIISTIGYMKVGTLNAGGSFEIDFEVTNAIVSGRNKMFKLTNSSNDTPNSRAGSGIVGSASTFPDIELSPSAGTVTGTAQIIGYSNG